MSKMLACPLCLSADVEFVGNSDNFVKYTCRDCDEDFYLKKKKNG